MSLWALRAAIPGNGAWLVAASNKNLERLQNPFAVENLPWIFYEVELVYYFDVYDSAPIPILCRISEIALRTKLENG